MGGERRSEQRGFDGKLRNLKRELTKTAKELEAYKNGARHIGVQMSRDRAGSVMSTEVNVETMSNSSRTSSERNHNHATASPNGSSRQPLSSPTPGSLNGDRSAAYAQYEAIEKPLLIDKILRLQKLHHKKNEKIENLMSQQDDQAKSQKKQQLVIKHLLYKIPRDQQDGKSVESASKQKRALAQENPKLLVEMNSMLQELLEDTIGQNAALKDNLKSLGAHLSSSSK